MLPKIHILAGLIASVLLYFLFPVTLLEVLIFFFSSFIIDFDHYLYYAYTNKDISLKQAYEWFMKHRKFMLSVKPEKRKDYKRVIMIFHGIEFWIVLILLVFVNKIFLFVILGVILHMIFDFIELYHIKLPFSYKISQIYTHIKNRDKEPINN